MSVHFSNILGRKYEGIWLNFLQPRNSATLGSGDLLKMSWNLKVYVIIRCIQKSVGTEHLDASQGSITWMPESTPPKQNSRSNLCDHLTERRWPSIRWASEFASWKWLQQDISKWQNEIKWVRLLDIVLINMAIRWLCITLYIFCYHT